LKRMMTISALVLVFTLLSSVTIVNSIELNHGYYLVKQGDTMETITSRFGVTPSQIVTANHLSNPPIIFPGKLLIIGETQRTESVNLAPLKGFVSLNFVDADIRDVLNIAAIKLNKDILFVGTPVRLTIRASKVAKKDLIDVIASTAGGLTWQYSGDIIVVGSKEKLTSDFSNSLLFTGIKLKYVKPKDLEIQSVKLNIDVKIIYLNEIKVWIKGRPSEIAKFYQLVNSLDKKENFPSSEVKTTNGTFYKQVTLKYVSASVFKSIIDRFALKILFINSETNPMMAFASGPVSSLTEFEQLLEKIDSKENTNNPSSGSSIGVSKYVLKHVEFSDAENLILNSKIEVTTMNIKNFPKTMFFFGAKVNRDEAINLLKNSIDIVGDLATEIVDFASDPAKLSDRRNLISSITGLSASDFIVSADISRDSGAEKYLLYFTGTEAEIAKVRQVVASMDSPLGGG